MHAKKQAGNNDAGHGGKAPDGQCSPSNVAGSERASPNGA
jgi:hypothetical protein